MGYDTSWGGEGLTIEPPLSPEEVAACRGMRELVPIRAETVASGIPVKVAGLGSTYWDVSDDGASIIVEGERGTPLGWLQLIHQKVLLPGNHGLFGSLEWEGEDGPLEDSGRIQCEGDIIRVFDAHYEVEWRERGVEYAEPPTGEQQ